MIKKKFKISLKIFTLVFLTVLYSAVYGQEKGSSFEDGLIFLSTIIAYDSLFNQIPSDLDKVDTLYKIAVVYYDGNISEALLALTFATLPFNKMSAKIPFMNVRIPLYLPSVNEHIFKKKKNNLPGKVLFNSNYKYGLDKDKVAHFFGNAFLSYNVSFLNLSKFFGFIVEMFESAFQVSNGVDIRDLQVNYLGEYFGNSLRSNKNLKPSDFFKVYSLFYFSYN
ncbi:MAG: hypothetical protein OQJ81_02430 [Melioribacteraceae bacterium]|nr:hypothetical protein [Melioribacteraceae bacterium]